MSGNPLILVVDDDSDIREVLALVLSDAGYSVVSAANGRDALRILDKSHLPFTLVLLDMMMPEMDGGELVCRLRSSAHAHIPVVVMSGQAGVEAKARALGLDDCLTKPMELPVLLDTIRRVATGATREVPAHP